jgi:hypothetical protein
MWKVTIEIWHSIVDFAGRDRVKTLKAQLRQPGSGFEPWIFEVTSRNAKYSMALYYKRHEMPVRWNPTTYQYALIPETYIWIGCKKYEGNIILLISILLRRLRHREYYEYEREGFNCILGHAVDCIWLRIRSNRELLWTWSYIEWKEIFWVLYHISFS